MTSSDIHIYKDQIRLTDPVGRDSCKFCCSKLASTDWMQKFLDPDIAAIPEIVEVQFKSIKKVFCKNPHKYKLKVGDFVVVECAAGYDIGFVSISSDLVRLQMKKRISKQTQMR
jgi:hypothetical protein